MGIGQTTTPLRKPQTAAPRRRRQPARSPRARRGAEVAHGGDRPERGRVGVGGVDADGVAPPGRERRLADRAVLGVLQGEEDEDDGDGDARVEAGGQDVCGAQSVAVSDGYTVHNRADRDEGTHSCTSSTRRSGGGG